MSDEPADIDDYLRKGGVLTSPANAPARYRAELMRLMAAFIDSELAGAAGFAGIINLGPGVKERIAAAKIVLEKNDHADQVLKIMGEFGADVTRYVQHHPWEDRLPRDAEVGATRASNDMRLAVLNYPLDGWTDAVVMNLLMGAATGVQLDDYATISYQPLRDAFRRIAPVERRHAELAIEGLVKLIDEDRDAVGEAQASVDYWWPRVATSFGADHSPRTDALTAMGLRKLDNAALRQRWRERAEAALTALGLEPPG